MTRFKLKAMFAVVGLIIGATIWASAGISQDNEPQPAPAAGLPAAGSPGGGAPPSAIAAPAAGLPGEPGRPTTVPKPGDPAVTTDSKGRPAPTPSLRPGETATERLDRLRVNPAGPPAPGFGIPGAPASQPAVVAEMPALRVIPVESLNASSLKEIVETLIPTARGLVAVDAQTNSLVVRVSDATVDEIKKLALHLQEMQRAMPKVNDAGRGRGPGGGSGFGAGLEGGSDTGASSGMSRGGGGGRLGEPVVERQVSLAELKRDYERADKAARDFAATMKSSSKRNDDSLASLQNRVAYAFSLRQTFLRVELAEMQRRVTMIQESIDLRDQVARQIIERRASELLDPNLQWEPASTPAIGPGGFIDSNGVQWPRPTGLPGGMAPGAEGAEGSSSSGSNGKATFTSEAVPIIPSNTRIFSGFSGRKAADPAAGSLPLDSDVHKVQGVTLRFESDPKLVDRQVPAIVMQQTPLRTLLVAATWGVDAFLPETDRRPIISTKVNGTDSTVELVAVDHQLGIAIFSVPPSVGNRLAPWPKDEIADVRIGDLITCQGTPHRVTSLDEDFHYRDVDGDSFVTGVFIYGGKTRDNPGSLLFKDGNLAGMLIDSADLDLSRISTPTGDWKSYALPAQALFDRFHQLIEKNNNPNERSPSAAKVSSGRPFLSRDIFEETNDKAEPQRSRNKPDASNGSGNNPDVSSAGAEGVGDAAKPSNSGPVWTLHMSAPWRGAERDAPAIVIDANDQRSILLSASWSAQRFPIGEEGAPDEGAPVRSITLVGSNLPVRAVDNDDQLGIAIYSVRTKLPMWPVDQLSSDIRVGDVVDELSSAGHFGSTKPITRHRVESVGNTLLTGASILIDTKIEGTFVLDGRMSGNPGSILLKDGKLAGMFLDNSRAADSSESKSHGLPTKTLLERARLLMKRSQRPVLK